LNALDILNVWNMAITVTTTIIAAITVTAHNMRTCTGIRWRLSYLLTSPAPIIHDVVQMNDEVAGCSLQAAACKHSCCLQAAELESLNRRLRVE
jgi:hypothetical protein